MGSQQTGLNFEWRLSIVTISQKLKCDSSLNRQLAACLFTFLETCFDVHICNLLTCIKRTFFMTVRVLARNYPVNCVRVNLFTILYILWGSPCPSRNYLRAYISIDNAVTLTCDMFITFE